MKIINLLYLRYLLSFSICLVSTFVIFFIFSLIGNLNEDYDFQKIINISFLNSFQIISFVTSFVFLMSVILLTIFLKSKNEIIIIKNYMGIKKLSIFFVPIIILFSVLESNKNYISLSIENIKENIIENNQLGKSKILIENKDFTKRLVVINNIDTTNINKTEYRSYMISDNKIQRASFSNSLIFSNNTLMAKNYTEYKNNFIEEINEKIILNIDITNLISQKSKVTDISENSNFEIDIRLLNLLIFYIVLFYFIFLCFFSKMIVSTKQSLKKPISISVVMLIYSLFIFNNSLSFYKYEFEFMATIIVGMFFLNVILNE